MTSPDGCRVEVYAALPAEPELSIVASHAGEHARILDLGCGAGRLAEPLAKRGHYVVGVDESAEMLAALRNVSPVHAPIAELNLGDTFDLVLLLSYLVNAVDAQARSALLATCARHVSPTGTVLIQRHEPGERLLPGVRAIRASSCRDHRHQRLGVAGRQRHHHIRTGQPDLAPTVDRADPR